MARKQIMKVYHGIPKSITDEHTIFYASFDGAIKPEIGQLLSCNYANPRFVPSAIGYGLKNDVYSYSTAYKTSFNSKTNDQFTVDMVIDSSHISTFSSSEQYGGYLNSGTTPRVRFLSWQDNKNTLSVRFYNSVGGAIDTIKIKLEAMINHVRLTYNNDVVKIYVNGRETTKYTKLTNCKIDNLHIYQLQAIISDLRISDIDRGDYFPNLPQDFIDGKAVIKPRMGQQQIKGDPIYSQTTTVKIPAFTNETSKLYCRYDNNTEGYLIDNPEIFDVVNANEWNQGSTFKIRGLNGEIVSGVIDRDTALCVITSDSVSAQQWTVNDVSKLREGDSIVCTTPDFANSSPVGTISEINTDTKTIKLSSPLAGFEALKGYYIFETSVTSSCPTVKTKTGTKVEGTWSGLGTKEAKFILSDNPTSLKGQDLYVEYSLNIPYGNSDFPEIPYSVERAWGENGVEMKQTNTLTIVDDFFGKVGGSLKECPHIMDRYFNYGLIPLDKITDKSSYQSYYNTLATKNDSTVHTSTDTSTGRGQIAFDIDLIEMVERKLGAPIPQVNKVSWLKSNVIQIRFNHYGYGVSSQGSKLYLAKYNAETQDWNTPGVSTTSSDVTLLRQVINPNYYEIDEKGHIYFLAYTDTSDGNVTATVRTDYISVEIDLKLDSNYTLMYCNNKRAREDKCNPVLIQKETKTVKRYFPSNECFTTESTRLSYKDVAKAETGEILSLLPYKIVTTNGTANLTRDDRGVNTYTDKIFLPSGYNPYNFSSSPVCVSETDSAVSHTVQLPIVRYWGGKRYHGVGTLSSGLDSCQTMTTKTDKEGVQQYEIYAGLKNVKGQLVLVLRTDIRLPNNSTTPSTYTNRDYALPNRPLIK